MPLIDAFITIDTLTPTVLAFGQLFNRAITATAKLSAVKVAPQIRQLAEAPRPVVYPIQWRSVKQRRAFFATRGFGKGIPYQRTGKTAAAWNVEVEAVDNVTVVAISNAVPSAEYVYGRVNDPRYQQPFHINTGWATANDIVTVGQELMVADMRSQLAPAFANLLKVG